MQIASQRQSALKFQANVTYTSYDIIILLPLSQEIPYNIMPYWLTPWYSSICHGWDCKRKRL